jgi:hypothetical protein
MAAEDQNRAGRKAEGHEGGWGDVRSATRKVDPGAAPSHLDHATGIHIKRNPLVMAKNVPDGMAAHGITARPASHVFEVAPKLRTARNTLNENLDHVCTMLSTVHGNERGDSIICLLVDVKDTFMKDGAAAK